MQSAMMWLNLYGCQQLWGCLMLALKQAKKAYFSANIGQPDDHTGWASSLHFALIYPINPRTNPWNFWVKMLIIGSFENLCFLESAISTSCEIGY